MLRGHLSKFTRSGRVMLRSDLVRKWRSVKPLEHIHFNRRLAQDSLVIGVVVTFIVFLIDFTGGLGPLERSLYDARASLFHFFTPPPTDSIVHIDVDDTALEAMGENAGSWPWRRSLLAELLDEVRLAGVKALAMDVVFPEPQRKEWIKEAGDDPDAKPKLMDHDAALAAAIKRMGCVIIPVDTQFTPAMEPLRKAMINFLSLNPEASMADLSTYLKSQGFAAAQVDDRIQRFLDSDRREAMLRRIKTELSVGLMDRETLRPRVIKQRPSWLDPLFDAQYRKARDDIAIDALLLPPNPRYPMPFSASLSLTPIEALGRAAAKTAFITYPQYRDGVVRSVPMFVECDGKFVPQIGLTLACMMLNVDPQSIRYEADGSLVIPRQGGNDIRIPVRTLHSEELNRQVPLLMDVPWLPGGKLFKRSRWEYIYDPQHQAPKQHLSMNLIWGIREANQKIVINNLAADASLRELKRYLPPEEAAKLPEKPLNQDDFDGRKPHMEAVLKSLEFQFGGGEADLDPKDPDYLKTKEMLGRYQDLGKALKENEGLKRELGQSRARLKAELNGRAAILGFVATSLIRDKVNTSTYTDCPGVVVHGLIYNAIMTGEMWRTLPSWVTMLSTLFLGLATTAVAARFPPTRALLSALLLLALFLFINCYVLFDYGNRLMGTAGPIVVIGATWAACTLARLILERIERAQITKRFRSYVDPKLVDFIQKHPELPTFEGQTREMTVVFTDLGNFTALTAKLGARTVVMLNDFLGRMVPVIRKHNGIVNKFLGDGIMFFYGAPEISKTHARDAIATVLEMQSVLKQFNRELEADGLPPVTLRAGVSTGNMIVGDAGAADASDYTVLGDAVNYGARLESANKPFGTSTLITERTIELGKDGFLLRPVGKPAVVGRQEQTPDMTYEVLGRLDTATEEERRLAEISKEIVDHFVAKRFEQALAAAKVMDEEFDHCKFAKLYISECERLIAEGAPPDFVGEIVLTSK